ncbi:biotin-dependent carboxyltransferase family protein [Trujillonella humicola]|uniref:5-oxoprolinase subunit C family protein n=1 Tax=Trujillonella humicola TaxID=3383699 RepID=UPI0039067AA7
MPVDVREPGLATTVQDLGRPGQYNVGIPPSGALDLGSARMANMLVGNPEDAAVLEAPYMAPTLGFTEPTVVAVTGADLEPRLNGVSVPTWQSFEVQAGDELSFGYLRSGARVYIAAAGGFDVPHVLGSRSTYALGALGGHEGRALRAGDVLPLGAERRGAAGRAVPADLVPVFSREVELRVVLGLYDYRLSGQGREVLLSADWALTPVADRTGFRYSGATLEFVERTQPFGAGSDPSNIVDAGYPIGSIQVPGGVEPIILHRDAVSGGGYAMVGTVISSDLDLVAQCSPGTRTRFVPVTLEQALAARAEKHRYLEKVRRAVAA